MNTVQKRFEELTRRAVVKNRLRDVTMRDGWAEIVRIKDDHLAKHEKLSRSRTLRDESRVRELDIVRAIEDLFIDIEKQIEQGNSAEQTLSKERGGEK